MLPNHEMGGAGSMSEPTDEGRKATTLPGPWPLGEPFPALLTPAQLMRVLQVGRSRFHQRQARGEFRFLEVSRPVTLARYSGELVRRYVAGQSTAYFGSGSRTARRGAVMNAKGQCG